MQYDYNEIIKMLEQNQQQYTNMIFELNKYTQTRLENINNNFQLRMAQINLELQDICMRSSLQQQQITSAFNALNNKVIRIYQNSSSYSQLQNIKYLCEPYFQVNTPKSLIESIIQDAVKSVLCNFLKAHLTEDEKHDFDLCNDILDAFDISSTLHDPSKTKWDKGYALIKASELLNKYFPF